MQDIIQDIKNPRYHKIVSRYTIASDFYTVIKNV